MTNEDYRQSIRESKRKLAELKAQRDQLDIEMGKLRLLIFANANMLPDDERDEAMEGVSEETLAQRIGLTDAIRKALENAGDWQSPKQIRDSLENSGYDLAEYGNVMASIHTVLKRLFTAGHAERKDADAGGSVYKWSGIVPLSSMSGNLQRVTLSQSVRLAQRTNAVTLDPNKLPDDIKAVIRPRITRQPIIARRIVEDVPNPHAKTLAGMLKETTKK
jgi:hypothetical protein